MKKILNHITKKASYAMGLGAAALIGGLIAGVALAAIPDSNGTIHGCYRNTAGLANPKGSLRVINTTSGETCTGQETSLNWGSDTTQTGYVHVFGNNGTTSDNTVDTAHTKGVLSFKYVDASSVYDNSRANWTQGDNGGYCFNLAFLPNAYSAEEVYNIPIFANTSDGIDLVSNVYCGPGYNAFVFELPASTVSTSFVFFR